MYDLIRKLFSLLPRADRWKLGALLLMMLVGSVLEVVGIGMIPVFISIIASPDRVLDVEWLAPVFAYLEIEDGGDLLVYGGLLLITVFAVKNAYILAFRYIEARFIYNRFVTIGSGLFERYMTAPYTFILSRNSSELLRNVTNETKYLAKNIMAPLLKLGMDVLLITGTVILLLLVDPWMTLAAIVLFGLAGGGFLKAIRTRMQRHGKRAQNDRRMMLQAVGEGIGGIKDIKVLGREKWFSRRFKRYISSYSKAQIFRQVSSAATKPVLETLSVAGMLLIVMMLFWQGRGLDTIIPLLALFGAAAMRLLPAVREAVKAINTLRYYAYAIDPVYNDTRYLESVAGPAGTSRKKGGAEPLPFNREIVFDNVAYSYPDSSLPAVSRISITIPRGSAVGFIGPSGAGKTTVVDLLLGLLQPEQGRIAVDGLDIREDLRRWQRNIGYIPQFIFLADDTVKRNIAFGLPDEEIDEERLAAAIDAAQLGGTIEQLPKGIDTVIGERGARLSGGQRQRIGIARALYGNPSVLIMDEATSALDNETEKYVIGAIERLKGERTIIMIAHRLTTVRNCDRLFRMERGKVVQEGRYEDVVKGDSGAPAVLGSR